MSNQRIALTLILGLVFVVGLTAIIIWDEGRGAVTGLPDQNTDDRDEYTLAEVAKHADAQSCWAVVNNKVYDLSAWISAHPGGELPILSLCGSDATQAFTAQHRDAAEPNSRLAEFEIGQLKQD